MCVRVSNGAAVDGISVCTREGSWFLHEVIFMASSEGIDKRFVALALGQATDDALVLGQAYPHNCPIVSSDRLR